MPFSERSQNELRQILCKISADTDSQFSDQELSELSLMLLALCSQTLQMRMREKEVERPLPGTGKMAPERIKAKAPAQLDLFNQSLDGRGGNDTSDASSCPPCL